MPPTTTTTQPSTALSLIQHGLAMELAGLLWGLVVQNTPFPRLALTAHIQFMSNGAITLVAGLLLHQSELIELGPVRCRIAFWALVSAWVVVFSECANAFWGTKEMLPLAAEAAHAEGALAWQEQLVTAAHILPSLGLIAAYGILLHGAFVVKGRKLKD